MKRLYDSLIRQQLTSDEQMFFLVGSRRVGKTTTSQHASPGHRSLYLNWDAVHDRELIMQGYDAILKALEYEKYAMINKPIIIFDEIHKFDGWRSYLKGFYDYYHKKIHIIVTGSSKLDAYNSSGDSMMGRYFLYHMHPLSIGEILRQDISKDLIQQPTKISAHNFDRLYRFGGFPEPYIKASTAFLRRWHLMRHQQLFGKELLELTNVSEIARIERLAFLLREQIGQTTVFANFAKKVEVSAVTIKRWLSDLHSLYYCFAIKPWAKNITRSLVKEPKYYLWDWTLVPEGGARIENLVASHLYKAVQFWTDLGEGRFELYYLRDRDKREVDFIVTWDEQPWFLVEVKSSMNQPITPELRYFHEKTGAQHAFQVAFDMPYVDRDCFSFHEPIIVPLKTLLSQLV